MRRLVTYAAACISVVIASAGAAGKPGVMLASVGILAAVALAHSIREEH